MAHTAKTFLGNGLNFPIRTDSHGQILLVTDSEDIDQSIRMIIGTTPGERVMRPEFGCRIHELVFAPHNAATEGLAVLYVTQALDRWEPRIEVKGVDVATDAGHDGALLLEIKYRVRDTYNERSIVYPFYLSGEAEPGE